MNNQEKFEKWAETEGYDLTKNLHSSYHFHDYECDYAENSWFGWQAAQADHIELIDELNEEIGELYKRLEGLGNNFAKAFMAKRQLQLDNAKLRENLFQASRNLDLLEPSSTMCKLVSETLSTTSQE